MAAKVAAHQGAETIVIWLTFVALLTMIPGVIAVGMLARRNAPRLGTTGLVLAFAGFMCLFWSTVAGSDNVALAAARIGPSPAVTGKLVDAMGAIPAIGLASNLFVLGHVVGLGLIGIALWRGRVLPAWAALMIAISQLLHAVFAIIVPVHALDGRGLRGGRHVHGARAQPGRELRTLSGLQGRHGRRPPAAADRAPAQG